ncbi:MAG: DUF1844 domain-containing protein [Planctomycetes bacterium]|nr:DUF1844 domain-containing protein [Planctomycetota bacterium]
MSDQPGETPKIHVDSDWKSQAQAEKQRLADLEAAKKGSAPAPDAGTADGQAADGQAGDEQRQQEIPPANWETLVMALATQALMCLGGTVDPKTNRVLVDLEAGKHHIDLLAVLEEKTAGNLSDEEANQLKSIIHELQMQFVRIAQAAASSMQQGGQGGAVAPGAGPGAGPGEADAMRDMANQLRMTEE